MKQATELIFIAILAAILYAFSPAAGLFGGARATPGLSIEIRHRILADPHQADLRARIGEQSVLSIRTDEDGRVVLRSGEREVGSPVFSGTKNTMTVPTDQVGVFSVEFQPGAKPGQAADVSILVGVVVVEPK